MKFITGDETGLIKQILVESKKIQRWGTQKRDYSVERMIWCGPKGDEESQIAVALRNGMIKVWNLSDTKAIYEYNTEYENPKGLDIIYDNEKRSLITCNDEGHVTVYSLDTKELVEDFQVDSPIETMRLCPYDNNIIAVGGNENDLQLYNVSTHDSIWKSRNVSNDYLDLRVPICIKDIQFMKCTSKGYKLLTVTGYNQIRIYETQIKRKPIEDYNLGDKPFVTCLLTADESYLIVSDTTGRVSKFDMHTHRLSGVFKGNVGSVRGLAYQSELQQVATVGLDRILRVYDVSTRELKHRIYLRQKLNTVLFSKEGIIDTIQDDNNNEDNNKDKDDKPMKSKDSQNPDFSDDDLLLTSDEENNDNNEEDDNSDNNNKEEDNVDDDDDEEEEEDNSDNNEEDDEEEEDNSDESTNDDDNVFKDDDDDDDEDEEDEE